MVRNSSFQVVLILTLLHVLSVVVTTEKYHSIPSVKYSYIHNYWKSLIHTKKTVEIIPLSEYLRQIRGGVASTDTTNGDTKKKKLSIGHRIKRKKNSIGIPSTSVSKNMGIDIVFSDVDGTLVHYEKNPTTDNSEDNALLHLPASTTGMRGVISTKTIQLVAELRKNNIKFVLVSGMRTSTLIKRLPFLPRADAYASEAGGRIFYPKTANGRNGDGNRITIIPEYVDGMSQNYLEPFTLEEDVEWRRRMSLEHAAGSDGYAGDALEEMKANGDNVSAFIPIEKRSGALWEFARRLLKKGFVLDTKGYSSCFRVNLKQQNSKFISDDDFTQLSSYNVSEMGLGSSVNLGCVDFYPIGSGKKNCCVYLAKKFAVEENGIRKDFSDTECLQRAICLCDDDNDIEMAMACRVSYLPSVSSSSIASIAAKYPAKFIITEEDLIVSTAATEAALHQVIGDINVRIP